ncbi:MAG: MocR-like pyridoxine biosynthesis transcription factor PdxR, partial [Neobacillus sp.]
MELTPFIKKDGVIPIYLQLYHFFREEIENHRLKEGTKLPSIRQLSQSLNVSRNTVESAFQQLVAEGYIESKVKSGLFVLKVEDFHIDQNNVNKESPIITRSSNHRNGIDFQYGDIELDRFPQKVWKKCLVDAMENPDHEVFSYGDKKGHFGLRSEIAGYLQQARGVRCNPDQIVLCAGTQTAIGLICQLLALPNKKVAMENPGYDGVRFVFESYQCQLVPISLEADGINIDELECSSAKCAYVTPSHQFPMGMILPIQKRLKLLHWASRNQKYIIEDDYDGEFRYQGQPIPSLKSLDAHDNVIYLGTFSKAFLPAARVSYM